MSAREFLQLSLKMLFPYNYELQLQLAAYKIQKRNKKKKNAIRIVSKRVKNPILRQTTQLLKNTKITKEKNLNPNIKHNNYIRMNTSQFDRRRFD